ncbi:hypothetical protein GQ53DRAFT_316466 [Thozetella sp. PMI_491]|nr:hypothetical protein GQ53DRAFT_316466 [Thozetella sp. PMI_491]
MARASVRLRRGRPPAALCRFELLPSFWLPCGRVAASNIPKTPLFLRGIRYQNGTDTLYSGAVGPLSSSEDNLVLNHVSPGLEVLPESAAGCRLPLDAALRRLASSLRECILSAWRSMNACSFRGSR